MHMHQGSCVRGPGGHTGLHSDQVSWLKAGELAAQTRMWLAFLPTAGPWQRPCVPSLWARLPAPGSKVFPTGLEGGEKWSLSAFSLPACPVCQAESQAQPLSSGHLPPPLPDSDCPPEGDCQMGRGKRWGNESYNGG